MKKILWVINPLQFREHHTSYPQYICRLMQGKLTGVLLENDTGVVVHTQTGLPGYRTSSQIKNLSDDEHNNRATHQNRRVLEMIKNTGYCVNFHRDSGIPLDEVIRESRFADLLLINATLSFDDAEPNRPSQFVKDVLSRAECPVLIMPEQHCDIKEIVFTYNGSFSSVFAIKQFTYLFPALKDLPVTVLYAPEKKVSETIETKRFIAELLRSHYSNLGFKVLHNNLDTALYAEILLKNNTVVTFGGYGSECHSSGLHKCDAKNALHSFDLPVFVTPA